MKIFTPFRHTAFFLLAVIFCIPQLYSQTPDLSLFGNMKPRNIGPAGMSGRVTSIDVVLPEAKEIFAGTASGGLWKSENAGITWTPVFDDQPVASIGAVAVYQKNPAIIWVGTGEGNPRNSQTSGNGVYRSIDGGKTWEHLGLEGTRNIHRLIIHPDNPDVVYVGAQGSAWGESENRGVYKTTDGGKNWKKILYVNSSTGIGDMVMDPSNPNKLMAAMWQFRRWPWYFKSGGEGSGLYVTYDGGENWKKRTDKDGLPEGELGRMGLAIAKNNPKVVYALVEAKKNALYRSDDGGYKWRKVNDKESDIGGRPFYYADIYVDPQNENRLYSIHSTITRTEDGGKSFRTIAPYYGSGGIHPDHHAFWIHPDDPSYLINGNDGGLNISRDMGENWRFIENLPVGQFYHINVDNDIPYHVYGGMQDNGSWRGPAYVWRSGGIRNAYFDEVSFGDGFDVVPDPESSLRGYSMSQGGELYRWDAVTGAVKQLKPVHPDGTRLRFNWNAGIAQDPFDAATIYYGSQFLHKSTNRGESWEVISPDLTSNDPEKQKQLESGGLTYDVTDAENYTTIITVSPSPVQEGVIWVGTDDGNLHLTQDGGKSWKNLSKKLKEVPEGAWIPQVTASPHQAGEAFVVVNDYRRDNWTPWLYRTRDFGKTWERLIDENDVWGYVLSFVQDPVEPKLMFVGTEFGLYVSIDGGTNWAKWTEGYPTVSTMDLTIHPREHDLVIGTFGRSIYVMDDIRPFRAVAKEGISVLNNPLTAFETPVAYLAEWGQGAGTRFTGSAYFQGDNRSGGAMISFYLNPDQFEKKEEGEDKDKMKKENAGPRQGKKDKVKIQIVDEQGNVIRNITQEPDSGLNRIYWRLDRKGTMMYMPEWMRSSGMGGDEREASGGSVVPGTYTARIMYQDFSDSTSVTVKFDPRLEINQADAEAMYTLRDDYLSYTAKIREYIDQLNMVKKSVGKVNELLPETDEEAVKAIKKHGKSIQDSAQAILDLILPDESKQGIYRDPSILDHFMDEARSATGFDGDSPNENQKTRLEQARSKADSILEKAQSFLDNDWTEYRKKAEALELSPFHGFDNGEK